MKPFLDMPPDLDPIGVPAPRYDLIPPPEIALCFAIGERAAAMRRALAARAMSEGRAYSLETSVFVLSQVIATTHLCRPLRLLDFLRADDLTFAGEFMLIDKYLDKVLCVFPKVITLRFAQSAH